MLSVLSLSLGCTDTLGWKNQWGDSCWTYTQRCRDGQFFAESWTQGADYNFPEKNCCACGKDSVVETRQPASPYPGAAAGGCQDHPNYVNQYGLDCAGYVRSGYCANGNVVQGQEWAMGADYGYPEKACCACGRDRPQCVDNDKWHNRYKGHVPQGEKVYYIEGFKPELLFGLAPFNLTTNGEEAAKFIYDIYEQNRSGGAHYTFQVRSMLNEYPELFPNKENIDWFISTHLRPLFRATHEVFGDFVQPWE